MDALVSKGPSPIHLRTETDLRILSEYLHVSNPKCNIPTSELFRINDNVSTITSWTEEEWAKEDKIEHW
jgi:hypothetical protein